MEFNTDDLIEEYLAGTMDAITQEQFERRMAADPDLSARVQLERELFCALGASAENELRANLRHISAKFETPDSLDERVATPPQRKRRILPGLLILLFMALVGAFFVFRALQTPTAVLPASPSAPAQQSAPGAPAQDAAPVQKPTQPNKAVQKSRPIASAYEPIPKLDSYIGSQFRSADFHVTVHTPAPDATLAAAGGKLEFALSGEIEGELPADAGLRILVFSNNLRDFEAMRPIENSALQLSAEGKFVFKKEIPTASGLYYYLIEEQQSGAWIYVARFQVH
jgi:hypothetical protein